MNPIDRDGYPFQWFGLIIQTGSNPPVLNNPSGLPLFNNFGEQITWSRVGVGIYRGAFTRSQLTAGLTFFVTYPFQSNSFPVIRIDANTFEIRAYVQPTNVLTDGQLTVYLSITVAR